VYSSNSPFARVENKEFLKLIEMLRPGYKPPNRHQIGNNLLHNVFETEKNACREKLHNQIVCMSFDGVSNIHNEPIISACITTEKGDTYLIDSFDTSRNSHFSEYLMNIVETAIKNVEETFGCIVGSIITDGAVNMVRMHYLMKKSFFITLNKNEKDAAFEFLKEKFGKAGENMIPKIMKFIIKAPFDSSHFLSDNIIKNLSALEWKA